MLLSRHIVSNKFNKIKAKFEANFMFASETLKGKQNEFPPHKWHFREGESSHSYHWCWKFWQHRSPNAKRKESFNPCIGSPLPSKEVTHSFNETNHPLDRCTWGGWIETVKTYFILRRHYLSFLKNVQSILHAQKNKHIPCPIMNRKARSAPT